MKSSVLLKAFLLAGFGFMLTSCSILDINNKGASTKSGELNAESAYADNYNPGANYVQIWADEFTGPNIDTSKWNFEVKGDGMGNQELEYYTSRPSNAFISNGNLVIQALRETYLGKNFTSARLNTLNKFAFRYGKMAAKIKMPSSGVGVWPAFWMMGRNQPIGGWPACGEIDIAEIAGDGSIGDQVLYGTFHWYHTATNYTGQADFGLKYTNATKLSADYHVYEVEWTTNQIKISFDGSNFVSLGINDNAIADFQYPQFILLNLAVGGTFFNPAITDPALITAVFPQQMLVDWIRVYSNTSLALPPVLDGNSQLGVFSDTHNAVNVFNRGGSLAIWASTGTIAANSSAAHEGSTGWQVTAGSLGWLGFSVPTGFMAENLINYQNTYLKFWIKTTSTATYEAGMQSGNALNKWIILNSAYGYIADGQWHQVTIPMSALGGLDLTLISAYFMFCSTTPVTAGDVIYIDDIYIDSKGAGYTPPAGPSGVDICINSETHTAWPVFSNGAALDSWSSTVTITSDPAAAHEGSTGYKVTVGNAGWTGWGVSTAQAKDMSAYANSSLKFWIKTTSAMPFEIGVMSGNGVSAYFPMDSTVGFANDGQWHQISLPMSQMYGVDFKNITQYFMFLNLGTATSGDVFYVDDIYWAAATAPASSSAAVSSSSSVTASSTASSTGGETQAAIVAATASTIVGANTALMSFDGNTGTRWESTAADPQWIYWDLGSSKALSKIIIDWEGASASNYTIQGSVDASTWTTLATAVNAIGMVNHLMITNTISGTYRYVKMNGATRTTIYGYSINEVAIFTGTTASSSTPPASSSTPPASSSSSVASSTAAGGQLTIVAATALTVNGVNTAAASYDNNTGTRWESTVADPQWIYWDLGSSKSLGMIVIDWEVASASNYTIQGSVDASTWTTLATVVNTKSTDHNIITNTISGTYRYVKMNGTTRTSIWGYSIWEVSIFSSAASSSSSSSAGAVTLQSLNKATSGSLTGSQYFYSLLAGNVDGVKTGTLAQCWGLNDGEATNGAPALWVYVDLGANKNISETKIYFQTVDVRAQAYTIQYLPSGGNLNGTWSTAKTVTGNTLANTDDTFTAVSARYVRLYIATPYTSSPNPAWGLKWFEFEVYGN